MTLAALIIIATLAAVVIVGAGLALHRMAAHVERLDAAHAVERERLIVAAIAPDALTSLQKLEVTAKRSLANADLAAKLAERDLDRRMDRYEDDQHLEHIGGIG